MTKYIAVDIGASSGRLMLSSLDEEGKMSLTEIHRFKNGFSETAGADRWQIQHLTTEILKGLAKVKAAGIEECYVGIDTWGVDYCLLDEAGELMEAPIAYRDKRTQEAMADFDEKMPLTELYQRTGIQLMNFNTVFQLLVEDKEKLAKASSLLLIPDYLGYVFTGKQVLEKTNASTMQLLNLTTRKIDSEILAVLEVSEELFPPLVEPGSILGDLQQARFPEYDLPKEIGRAHV